MSVNVTNSKDLIVNSLSLIKGNHIEHVLEFFLSRDEAILGIVGLPNSTLATLEQSVWCIDSDPNFFLDNQTRLNQKADLISVRENFAFCSTP